jgi:5-hydroxyisourate hydrolase
MSPITTHVLNTMTGIPAANIAVSLCKENGKNQWKEIAAGITNADGRISDWLSADTELHLGKYQLTFDTGSYFKALGQKTFYPIVQIAFELDDLKRHTHVPLLLSAYGYTTYRGS